MPSGIKSLGKTKVSDWMDAGGFETSKVVISFAESIATSGWRAGCDCFFLRAGICRIGVENWRKFAVGVVTRCCTGNHGRWQWVPR